MAIGDGVDDSLLGQRVLGPTEFQAQRGGQSESFRQHGSVESQYEVVDKLHARPAATGAHVV